MKATLLTILSYPFIAIGFAFSFIHGAIAYGILKGDKFIENNTKTE